MSQVSHHPIRMAFERLVEGSAHVLAVQNMHQQIVVFEATLTREAHYDKTGETHYSETANLYRVVKVLKSDSIRIGDGIKVLREPAYDFAAMRRYHTTGVAESPEELTYQPAYPPDGDEMILFVSGPARFDSVWLQYLDAAEGLAAEQDILLALQASTTNRGVLPIDR
jgi:hypothetical protein